MLHKVCTSLSNFLVRNDIYYLYFNQTYEISCVKGKEGKQGRREGRPGKEHLRFLTSTTPARPQSPASCPTTWALCSRSPESHRRRLAFSQEVQTLPHNEKSLIASCGCMLSHFSHVRLMDCSPLGSVHGILQARILSGLPCPPPGDLRDPGIEPTCLTIFCIGRWVLYH